MMGNLDRDHRLDHIVVLMFENRSFDNLLGYLYAPGEVPAFEGVLGRGLRNPVPPDLAAPGSDFVEVHQAKNLDTPDPDPGEEYPHINNQMFGTVLPADNRLKSPKAMSPPFNAPGGGAQPNMSGFVGDYADCFRLAIGRWPKRSEFEQIMACYTPDQVPVITTLAREFACFDHWFCEVPSQTYCNRSFFHAASSSGMVLNSSTNGSFPVNNRAETIFERLERDGRSWRVYFDPRQIVSATGLIHASRLAPYFATHFRSHREFYEDAHIGTLPNYSFVEPCMIPPHSDMHPPGIPRLRRFLHLPPPSALKRGEQLLAKVYNAVRNSSSSTGSNWKNTLLLVTFDEHGGTYDHVPPPTVPPPDPATPIGEMGFKFDRSGVRIPTIAVSAWVEPKTVVNQEFRATSVIRTLRERWSLGPPLTHRDASAPDIAPVLSRATPRPMSEWPIVTPRVILPWATTLFNVLDSRRPLAPLSRHLFGAALAWEVNQTGRPQKIDLHVSSRRGAAKFVRQLHAAKFPGVNRRR